MDAVWRIWGSIFFRISRMKRDIHRCKVAGVCARMSGIVSFDDLFLWYLQSFQILMHHWVSVLVFLGMAFFLASSTSLSVRGVAKRENGACFPWERNTGGGGRLGFSWCLGWISCVLHLSSGGFPSASKVSKRSNADGAGSSLRDEACLSGVHACAVSSKNALMTSGGGTSASVSVSDSESVPQPGGATRKSRSRRRRSGLGEALVMLHSFFQWMNTSCYGELF